MATNARIYSNIVSGYKSVSSNPGVRTDPVTGKQAVHAGVDLPVAVGTPVKTPADGQIWATGSAPGGYGNFVIVAHPDAKNPTSLTMYGHLKEPVLLERGERVSTGTELGLSGNTGKSTGPHLHYEERVLKPGETVQFGNNAQNQIQFLTKTDYINPNTNALGFGTWNPSQVPRSDLTNKERVAQLALTDSEFESYKNQLASVETKGKTLDESYLTTSKSGTYLGRYQMGKTTGLVEAGFLDKDGKWTDYAKSQGVSSEKDFLNTPAAQDDALRILTNKNAEFLVRNNLDLRIGDTVGDTKLTEAGMLLGSHNSRGNLKSYVESDGAINKGDGNGFAISKYVELGKKVQSEATPPATTEDQDTTTFGERFTSLMSDARRIAVNAFPSLASVLEPDINPTDTDGSDAHINRHKPVESTPPRTPQKTDGSATRHFTSDGEPDGVTVTHIAKAESFELGIKVEKGDTVTTVFDANGKTTYLSVSHTVGNQTTITERSTDPATGEPILGTSTWVGSGPGSLQSRYQHDVNGQLVGERYVEGGETYRRSSDPDGKTQWLNERNQTEQEWRLDPTNPSSVNATNGMDLESPPARTVTPVPTQTTTPVGYKTVERDGHTYEVTAHGTLERPIPGHPGWLEQRDSTGGGVITDEKGVPVAQLLPGDRVNKTEDMRITVHDDAGKAVNRSVDGDVPAEFAPTPNQVARLSIDQVAAMQPGFTEASAAIAAAQSRAEIGAYTAAFAASNQFNSMVQGWEHMNDAQRITGLMTLYNQIDNLPTNTASTFLPDGTPTGHAKAGDNLPGSVSTPLAWVNMATTIDSMSQWDKMGDQARLSATLSLYTQANAVATQMKWGEIPGADYAGPALSYISLAQAIDKGDVAGMITSINSLSGNSIDLALNSALGSSAVPYVAVVMALNDFDKHPGQSIGSLVGTLCFGPVGSMIGGMIGGALDSAFGPKPDKPVPIGEVHFAWDSEGDIQINVDVNKNKGADAATSVATSVLGMLEQMVEGLNAQTLQANPNTPASDLLAINPNLLPRIGYSYNHEKQASYTWMEITQPDGSTTQESLSQANLAQRLLEVLTDNGGLAAQWLVDTQEARFQHMVESGADGAAIYRELHAGQGGHAYAGNQAHALHGNAVESADFRSQTFGTLVVRAMQRGEEALGETLEQLKTIEALRDVENDGFMEATQWVAAADDLGRTQGLLVIDFNNNQQIETRDILNLGGNAAEAGNVSDEAIASRANADLQRNNVQWLDADGSTVLEHECYAFSSYLSNQNICQQPFSCLSANDSAWRHAA